MMKNLIISLCLISLVNTAIFSQNDLRKDIMNYKEGEYDFINKGRRLLKDELKAGDLFRAVEIKNTLLDEYSGDVSKVFYNNEYINLLFWTREYREVLNFMKQIDMELAVSSHVRISSQTDGLSSTLFQNTLETNDIIGIDIREEIDDAMERDFLQLLLFVMTDTTKPYTAEKDNYTAEINKKAEKFLSDYPTNPYSDFVRKNIRFAFRDTSWGFYMDVGFGYAHNTNGLGNKFGNGGGMQILFEYRYHKLATLLELGFTGHTLKEDIHVKNTIWEKSSSATIGYVTLNSGYLLFENKRWTFYPFGGIGFGGFSTSEIESNKNEALKNLGLNAFFPKLGCAVDYKFKSGNSLYGNVGSRISLRYNFHMYRFEQKDPLLIGGQHFFTLSFGIGGRGLERDI